MPTAVVAKAITNLLLVRLTWHSRADGSDINLTYITLCSIISKYLLTCFKTATKHFSDNDREKGNIFPHPLVQSEEMWEFDFCSSLISNISLSAPNSKTLNISKRLADWCEFFDSCKDGSLNGVTQKSDAISIMENTCSDRLLGLRKTNCTYSWKIQS